MLDDQRQRLVSVLAVVRFTRAIKDEVR